jgi:hypothetical protein
MLQLLQQFLLLLQCISLRLHTARHQTQAHLGCAQLSELIRTVTNRWLKQAINEKHKVKL